MIGVIRDLCAGLRAMPPLLLALALAACASFHGEREGLAMLEQGRYEEGLARLEQAVAERPEEARLRVALATRRTQAVASLLSAAEREARAGQADAAERSLRRVLGIEPDNPRALDGLRRIEQSRHLEAMAGTARRALSRGDLESASKQLETMRALAPTDALTLALRREIDDQRVGRADALPQLRSRFSQPVSLEFRDASLKMILDVLSKSAGINFIFDKEIKSDLKATLFVRQVPIEDAIDLLLMQSQLAKKLINENTVLVFPNTPQKSREYEDLVIRTFHLANIDAASAQELIKTMLKTRDLFIDQRLNTLTMRDSRDAVRLAEKLLLAQDVPDPEVVLEVEVLEVSRQRILDLGLRWPSTFDVLGPAGLAPTILDDLKGIDSRRIAISPAPQLRINAQDSDVNTLANPVIRVRNREKAKIHIGQRVPVVSATSTPSTQGPVITESIQYLEVGLKLEVEPTVHRNDDVAIRVSLEVSKATALTPTQNGTIPVQVDTRNATTLLQLRDGETQVLAGLMRNDHDNSGNRVPGLGDLPFVGHLFGSNSDTVAKTELVLSIRPRIVRNLPYMNSHQIEFSSGTEATPRASPLRLAQVADAQGKGDASPLVSDAALRLVEGGDGATAGKVAASAVLEEAELSWQGPSAIAPGEEATLALHIRAPQAVRSTSLQFSFEPGALTLVDVTDGGFMGQDGARSSLTRRGDEALGAFLVNVSREGQGGATGEGVLLNLKVRAGTSAKRAQVRVWAVTGATSDRKLLKVRMPPPFDLGIQAP